MGHKVVIITGVVILSLVFGYLFYVYASASRLDDQPIILTYWDFYEHKVIQPYLDKFEADNPKIKINYTPQTLLNYQARVRNQIQSFQGPDVIKLHNSWASLFSKDLFPAPAKLISLVEFNDSFYPVAADSLTKDNKVYALPTELDGIVLYYNEDILKGVNAQVPKDWKELVDTATLVTVKNQEGVIQTAGVALGSTNNIDYWPEIIGLLFFQQPQANLKNPGNQAGADVLKFYTQFITDPKIKSWDVTLPKDTQMFIDGKLAFYFAPVAKADVMAKANPSLNFKTTPVPQLRDKPFAWGSFYSLAVSAKSPHPDEAWQLVKYLTSSQVQTSLVEYRPSSQKSLGSGITEDFILGAFVKQGNYYSWWYLNSKTQDQGINDEMVALYKMAVDNTLQGSNPQTALQNITSLVQTALTKWGGVDPKHK